MLPTCLKMRVLRGGTERAYSSVAFDIKGDQLATVGGYPDYLLTLWAWRDEAIVLRSKAFSQDVYTVRFSPYFDGQLCTSGGRGGGGAGGGSRGEKCVWPGLWQRVRGQVQPVMQVTAALWAHGQRAA